MYYRMILSYLESSLYSYQEDGWRKEDNHLAPIFD